jgi:hypothetical protein
MKRLILFRFDRNPLVCRARVALLRELNPSGPVCGTFGRKRGARHVRDALRFPLFAQILGVPIADTGFRRRWRDEDEDRFFNSPGRPIEPATITAELAKSDGRRAFRPVPRRLRTIERLRPSIRGHATPPVAVTSDAPGSYVKRLNDLCRPSSRRLAHRTQNLGSRRAREAQVAGRTSPRSSGT